MSNTAGLYAGVDIGATSVKIGIVTAAGVITGRGQQALVPSELEPHHVVELTALLLFKLLKSVR